MKKNKLKIITIILLILLITLVSFFGIYVKEKSSVNDIVKDYQYAMDIEGKRVVTLELDSTTEQITKDSEGKEIENATEEQIEQNGYTQEEVPVNSEESKTLENYKLTKEILEKRLSKLNVPSYNVRLDEQTGTIVIELPENDNTDNWVSNLTTVGKLEIVDTQTKEVLLNNDDIQNSEALSSTSTSGTSIYFSIEFNCEGKKKLEEITKTYVPTDSEEKASEEQATTENSEDTTTQKTITMKLDDSDVMTTSFDEPITDGKMYLTVGQASNDTDTLNDNLKQARNMATVLSNKNLPLNYNLNSNIYVASPIKDTFTNTMINIATLVMLIVAIILIVKYKAKGLIATIANIGFVGLLLLIIRYWNVVISTEGFAALIIVLVLNFIVLDKILDNINKEKDNKKAELKHIINISIKEFTLKIIPLFIMAVIFAFMRIRFYK